MLRDATFRLIGMPTVIVLCLPLVLQAIPTQPASLDLGYRQMYNLQFNDAHQTFRDFERLNPNDPLGPVSDAAAYLFAEFDRLHILQSEFFLHDDTFRNARQLAPDPGLKQKFDAALERTRQISSAILARNPGDERATFANILRLGLRSDYLALVEKRYAASFRDMKSGRMLASKLLEQNPKFYDAYVAVGVENYLLSQKPAPVRWMLRIGGAQIDKEQGIHNLSLAARNGRYLAPFARLLLAVAALRDNDRTHARQLLEGLATEFPQNGLYQEELARLR